MRQCNKRLWGESDGLRCTRQDPHEEGHIYHASDANDRHKEATQEEQE